MILKAQLISRPEVDFAALLSIGQTALGRNLARQVDASPIERSTTERYLACLGDLRSVDADQLLMHASCALLIVAHDADVFEIMQGAHLSVLVTDTLARGVQLCVLSGSLLEWKWCLARCSRQPMLCEFAEKCRVALVAGGMDVFAHSSTLLLE